MAAQCETAECKLCGATTGLKRCSRCKKIFYCSRDHQSKDWHDHKKLCSTDGKMYHRNRERQKYQSGEADEKSVVSGVGNHEVFQDGKKSGLVSFYQEQASAASVDVQKPEVEGLPFDTNPFKETHFQTPIDGFSSESVGKFVRHHLNDSGFCVVDGLFTTDEIDKIVGEIRQMDLNGELKTGQVAGGRTSGEDAEKSTKLGIRNDRIHWFDDNLDSIRAPGVSSAIKKMDDIIFQTTSGLPYRMEGRTKVMVACYPGNGSYYRRHIDNPNKDGRRITCILYLNKGWNVEQDGGLLRIFPEGGSYIDVVPIANRLLFFWSDKRNPHEVQPAYRTRYALTVWYLDGDERAIAKKEQSEMYLQDLTAKTALLEVTIKKTEKEILEKNMETKSLSAVGSLSDDEVNVLKMLVETHEDPKALLTSMGIASSIQKALLARLYKTED